MKRRQRLKAEATAREFCGAYESYGVVCEAMNKRAVDREPTPHENELVAAARSQVMQCYLQMRDALNMPKVTNHEELVAELLEKMDDEERKREAQTQAEADDGGNETPADGTGKPSAVADGVRTAIAGRKTRS